MRGTTRTLRWGGFRRGAGGGGGVGGGAGARSACLTALRSRNRGLRRVACSDRAMSRCANLRGGPSRRQERNRPHGHPSRTALESLYRTLPCLLSTPGGGCRRFLHMHLSPVTTLWHDPVSGNGEINDRRPHVDEPVGDVQRHPGGVVYQHLLGPVVERHAISVLPR